MQTPMSRFGKNCYFHELQHLLPMPRRPNYSKKSVKLQVEKLHRKCRYCKTHQDSRGFDRHEAWCKTKWRIRKELQELRTHPPTRSPTTTVPHLHATHISSPSLAAYEFEVNSDFVEGSSSMPMGAQDPLSGSLRLYEATDSTSTGRFLFNPISLTCFT